MCAECKAEDLEDEEREAIEFALAHLDALTAIEMSAAANAGGSYSPELLDRWDAMGEDNHRQRLLIKALILVGARLDALLHDLLPAYRGLMSGTLAGIPTVVKTAPKVTVTLVRWPYT